jgi:hypothetical protein
VYAHDEVHERDVGHQRGHHHPVRTASPLLVAPSSTECIRRRAAIEVAKLTVREDGIRAVAATKHFRHRGDTLNKATLTCDLSSPLRDVVEFTAAHFLVRTPLRHGCEAHSHAV